MSEDVRMEELVEVLPPRIWYLTSNGTDMWCRRPYGFLFSTGQAAEHSRRRWAPARSCSRSASMRARSSTTMLAGLRNSAVTRLFIDPSIDPESGDVHGKILRLAAADLIRTLPARRARRPDGRLPYARERCQEDSGRPPAMLSVVSSAHVDEPPPASSLPTHRGARRARPWPASSHVAGGLYSSMDLEAVGIVAVRCMR